FRHRQGRRHDHYRRRKCLTRRDPKRVVPLTSPLALGDCSSRLFWLNWPSVGPTIGLVISWNNSLTHPEKPSLAVWAGVGVAISRNNCLPQPRERVGGVTGRSTPRVGGGAE